MGAPKGNKNAYKPRQVKVFTDEQLVEFGEELLKWMQENENNNKIIHLSQFYRTLHDMTWQEWEDISERVCFRRYYNKAREWCGVKSMLNEKLQTSYANRFLGMYMADLRQFENEVVTEKAEIEAAAKAKEVTNITDKEQEQNAAIIRGVMAMQEALKKG